LLGFLLGFFFWYAIQYAIVCWLACYLVTQGWTRNVPTSLENPLQEKAEQLSPIIQLRVD